MTPNRILGATAAAATLIALAGCGTSSGSPANGGPPARTPANAGSPARTFTVAGHVTLTDTGIDWFRGEGCSGTDGYSDMAAGTQVVIRNAKGTSIGLGALGKGVRSSGGVVCTFPFTVTDVPIDGSLYSVEVSHRGAISFHQADAGHVELTLGY